jgi:hypothetical protein
MLIPMAGTPVKGRVEQLMAARQHAEEELLLAPMSQALSAEAGTEGFGYENIVGVGVAEREVGGSLAGQEAVAVYVERKVARELVDDAALVPSEYDGIPTDIVESGELVPQTGRGRYRPAPAGVSLAHHASTAGTLGFVAYRDGDLYVVSNNHVLAQENDADAEDSILQPGPADGGTEADEIARLAVWEPMDFNGGPNLVDAAMARTDADLVSREVYGMGALDWTPRSPSRGLVVRKRGRTSQLTQGVVQDVDATIKMPYSNGVAILTDQILVRGVNRTFSEGGDSGSLVFAEESRQPIGLLCGGSPRYSVVNRISPVLEALGLSLVA